MKVCEAPWEDVLDSMGRCVHSSFPRRRKISKGIEAFTSTNTGAPVPPMTADAPGEATQTPNPSFPRRRESTDFKCISGFPLKACGNDVNGRSRVGTKPTMGTRTRHHGNAHEATWEGVRGNMGRRARQHGNVHDAPREGVRGTI